MPTGEPRMVACPARRPTVRPRAQSRAAVGFAASLRNGCGRGDPHSGNGVRIPPQSAASWNACSSGGRLWPATFCWAVCESLPARFPQQTLGAIFCLDTLCLTVMLGLTGGPNNPFSLLYLVQIALSAIVLAEVLDVGAGRVVHRLLRIAVLLSPPAGRVSKLITCEAGFVSPLDRNVDRLRHRRRADHLLHRKNCRCPAAQGAGSS